MNEFLAKSDPLETIQEHTNNLMINYNILKNLYPNIKYLDWDILELACLYHDIGKINTKFQNKIRKNIGKAIIQDTNQDQEEIYHNFLSPAFLPHNKLKELYKAEELKVLYQSIYRHHKREEPSRANLIKTVKNDLEDKVDKFKYDEYSLLKNIDLSEGASFKYIKLIKDYILPRTDGKDTFYSYVITKGLLNKIDYAASTYVEGRGLEVEIPNNTLTKCTNSFFEKNKFEKNDLQTYMEENSEENNIIIASTGTGKTEGALLWIGDNKGFFTLPLRVSINAIYDRITTGDIGFKKAGLLHSDTYSEYLNRFDYGLDDYYYEQTRQMSLPLTISTLDQLIDFIFRYDGFEIKLATLAYSKLIVDEIQAYSAEYIGYLICALKFITDVGGKFTIMTATLPPIIEYFIKENNIEYKKGPVFLNEKTRHNVKVIEDNISVDDILTNYQDKKILVICNTVKKAQEIYIELDNKIKDYNINLLHSRFTKKRRKELEDQIIDLGSSKSKESGIWITTQVVEASLDIDFDVLYTELSDLAGLFQRMGRTYRKRELKEDSPYNVFVYTGCEDKFPSGVSKRETSLIDWDIFKSSKKEIIAQGNKIYTEELKMQMIDNAYSIDLLIDSSYSKKIKDTIKYIMGIEEYFFEKGEQKLRDIKNLSIIPSEIYTSNQDEINNILKKIGELKGAVNKKERQMQFSKLESYLVDIPYYMMNEKKTTFLEVSKYKQIMILNIKYDEKLGIINEAVDTNSQEDDNFF